MLGKVDDDPYGLDVFGLRVCAREDADREKLERELDAHELIKIRFVEFKRERRELTDRLADASHSEIAGIIGNTAILYREQRDPEKRRIQVPTRDPRAEDQPGP